MENNSDKQLRDKLNGTEFPFDPQAWEQMDAMLDKKKKRRGFFWWWTGGIAAVLVLVVGTIGWGLYLMDEDDKQPYETTVAVNNSNEQSKASNQLTVGKEEKSEIRNQKPENVIAAASSSSEQPKASKQLVVSNSEKSEVNRIEAGNGKLKRAKAKSEKLKVNSKGNGSTARIRGNHSSHQLTNAFSQENKQLAIGSKPQHNSRKQQTTNNKTVTDNTQPATAIQKEIEMLNAASAKKSSEENIRLDRKEATLLEYVSENATTSFDKKEEDALPKQKKKIFNYSLGVLANVTGTTLGSQNFSGNQRNRPVLFYKAPSYMIGFTHDFLFINRVAITNSILFSQTSFKVYQPKTVSFSITPKDYTSHITELDIPIGIKVYPVVKNNFRFYINTGIINHIKLRETFDYSPLSDTAYNATANLADHIMFPDQTNFTGSYAPSAFGVQGSSYSTKDFSINNAKRYYVSFYAGAGFEYVAKKHFVLFAEPMYYMSLQKIGVQDKRKYNFGLSGGFRYQF